MGTTSRELPAWESLQLLGSETVGRLCVIEHGYPLAFPLSYRLVGTAGETRIVFRTRPQTVVARYVGLASLEVDRVDETSRTAWSVIVRGSLRRVVGQHELPDPYPLVTAGRDQWVVLEVTAISGRRFTGTPATHGFALEWQPADV